MLKAEEQMELAVLKKHGAIVEPNVNLEIRRA